MTAAVVWMSPLKVKLQQNYIQNRLPDVVIQIAVVSLFITIFSRGGGGEDGTTPSEEATTIGTPKGRGTPVSSAPSDEAKLETIPGAVSPTHSDCLAGPSSTERLGTAHGHRRHMETPEREQHETQPEASKGT